MRWSGGAFMLLNGLILTAVAGPSLLLDPLSGGMKREMWLQLVLGVGSLLSGWLLLRKR
jgi:hypothetical protein